MDELLPMLPMIITTMIMPMNMLIMLNRLFQPVMLASAAARMT